MDKAQQTHWSTENIAAVVVSAGTQKNDLSVEAISALRTKGQIKKYDRDTLITQRGTKLPRFFLLLSGTTRLTAHTMNGNEFVSAYVEPGNFWGVHPCLAEVSETHDAVAVSDVVALVIEARDLRDLMWEHREIQEAMVQFLCSRLRMVVQVAEQFATWTPRARLAWRITEMVKSHGVKQPETGEVDISVSQEALASMINLSRQRTNLLLKEFERQGVLGIKYSGIKVLDQDGLRRHFEDPY